LAAALVSNAFGWPNPCNLTLSPGQDIQAGLNTPGVTTLCLSPGTYTTSSTITVPAGKTLQGTGSSRDDVVISSSTAIILAPSSNTTLYNFSIKGNNGSTDWGILVYFQSSVTVWSVHVQHVDIGLGFHTSTNVNLWDSNFTSNGRVSNGAADPNVWIYNSSNVVVYYGELDGAANGPGGDGELACYNTPYLHITGTHVLDSGASAIYLVNCDNAIVESVTIQRAGEWGLDIVGGSDSFLAQNNLIQWSYYGGAVFDQTVNTGGQFINNSFISNDQSANRGMCNGINVIGNLSAVYLSGNTSNGGAVACTFHP
jgi:hypothetical protein